MGLVGRILSFARAQRNGAQISDVKTDPGGGPNVTAEHFPPSGDDSHPLTTDYVFATESPQRGRFAAVGYVDPLNVPKAQPGEKRSYARNPEDGAPVVEHWLKADGTAVTENDAGSVTLRPDGSILGQNAAGSFELQAGGDFVVNGVVISPGGLVSGVTSLIAGGKEHVDHVHPAGTPPGNTGVNS